MATKFINDILGKVADHRAAKILRQVSDRVLPSGDDKALTATAGGVQATALPLKTTCAFHEVTTCATANDAIALPPARIGEIHFVKNSGATSMQVFGAGTDTIDSVATATGVAHAAGHAVLYVCLVAGNYIRLGGAVATSVFNAITATTITTSGAIVAGSSITEKHTPGVLNATGSLTAALIATGVITSTSAAPTTMTTVTATAIAAVISATTGTSYEFIIDNSAGANTVTLALDASITSPAGAITGGNTLTVTTTHKVGIFRLYFTSPTAAVIYRVA